MVMIVPFKGAAPAIILSFGDLCLSDPLLSRWFALTSVLVLWFRLS